LLLSSSATSLMAKAALWDWFPDFSKRSDSDESSISSDSILEMKRRRKDYLRWSLSRAPEYAKPAVEKQLKDFCHFCLASPVAPKAVPTQSASSMAPEAIRCALSKPPSVCSGGPGPITSPVRNNYCSLLQLLVSFHDTELAVVVLSYLEI
jgi:hypothetical protein